MDKQYKLIFNSYLARTLLVKYGHNIIDLKKDRNRKDGVIFVFEITERFLKDLETALKE